MKLEETKQDTANCFGSRLHQLPRGTMNSGEIFSRQNIVAEVVQDLGLPTMDTEEYPDIVNADRIALCSSASRRGALAQPRSLVVRYGPRVFH